MGFRNEPFFKTYIMIFAYYFVSIFQQIVLALVFVRVLLSWFGVSYKFLEDTTEWLLGPIRMLIPPIGGVLDLSPLLAFLLVQYVGDSLLWFISNQI